MKHGVVPESAADPALNAPPPIAGLLLRKIILRQWRQAPRQTLLLLAILSLGVSVFVAVRLANRAAIASFGHFTETLTGKSDWIIEPAAGTFPESVLGELREALGARPVHIVPVVEMNAASPGATDADKGAPGNTGKSYSLLGVDLLALANLVRADGEERPFFGRSASSRADGEAGDFWSSFRAGPRAWVSAASGLREGQALQLVVSERVVELPIAGLIPEGENSPRAPSNLVVLDLPHLQALAGKAGQLDRVEFLVEPGPDAAGRSEELRALLETLGAGRWTVLSPGARRETAEVMTRAFRLNLTVLSLIALLVGLYLIFQTLDGAVVRRRGEIAVLRSLGVTEKVIHRVWLAEAAVLGALGGAIGLLLGWAAAQGAVRGVAQTVNALYFATTAAAANLAGSEIVIAVLLGVGASLVAGWWPAREAARTPPAQMLGRHVLPTTGTGILRHGTFAVGLIVIGIAFVFLPPLRFAQGGRFPLAGYGAALLWIFGGGIICGSLLPWLASAGGLWGRRSAPARVALSHLRQPSSRHRFAVAALLCAIGMTAGMAILVSSFEDTIRGWIEQTLRADLYISSRGSQTPSSRNRLSPDVQRALATHPAVAEMGAVVIYPITLDGVTTHLSGADFNSRRTKQFLRFIDGMPDEAVFDPARNAALGLASETFCERFGKRRGDVVRVPTPAGPRDLTIAAVFADYGNERGSIMVHRGHLQTWFNDRHVTSIALMLKPDAVSADVRRELLAQFPGLSIYENAALRAEVLRVFRQTFSITYALEIIGVVVAIAGLAMTLTSVLLDRRDELTTVRALGFSRGEIACALAIEGTAIAICAVAGGLALSFALGWLLIYVVNKQSFGWTLGFACPWTQLAVFGVSIVATAAAVSYAVGRWGAALPADREE
jgi:putative ABC transport system permease protein